MRAGYTKRQEFFENCIFLIDMEVGKHMSQWTDAVKGMLEKDREEREAQRDKWLEKGSVTLPVLEFLEAGMRERWLFDNAQKRIFRRLFADPGILRMNWDTMLQRAKALGLSQDEELYLPVEFLDDFYDLEFVLHSMTLFAHNAAVGGEASKQMLGLFGPPGTAKSSLPEFMKIRFTDTVFFHIDGCPVHESPLRLLPKHLRAHFSQELGVRVPPHDDICHSCRYRLEYDCKFDWTKMRVSVNTISMRQKRGIAVVPPFDPNTMGSEILIGERRLEKLGLTGQVNPDELHHYFGAFDAGIGGMVEFREMFKAPKEIRDLLLIALQERQFPSPRYEEWFSSDFFVICHANIEETARWMANDENRAFFDRIYGIAVPYTTSYSGEMKIYEKMVRGGNVSSQARKVRDAEPQGDVKLKAYVTLPARLIDDAHAPHSAPYSQKFAAMFAAGSRLVPQGEGGWSGRQLIDLVLLLNAEGDNGDEAEKVRQRRKGNPTDGFFGFSTRFGEKAIEDSYAEALLRWDPHVSFSGDTRRAHACRSVEDIRRAFRRRLEYELLFSELGQSQKRKETARLQNLLQLLDGGFTEGFIEVILKPRVLKDLESSGLLALALGEGALDREIAGGLERYTGYVRAFLNGGAASAIVPDYLGKIETWLGVSGDEAQIFREQLVRDLDEQDPSAGPELSVSNERLERLRRAVKDYFLEQHMDTVLLKVREYIERQMGSPGEFERKVLSKLSSDYCPACVIEALKIVSSPLVPLHA